MSLNHSMGITLNSMKNNQMALSVVSHNIANLNTEGYARQRVDFSESILQNNQNGVAAKINSLDGSKLASITNYADASKFNRVINSNSDAQYYNKLADALGDLENVSDDLGDNGLNALINDFYAAVANLEQFPTDISMRQQYVMALDSVCDKFNYISDRYDTIQEDRYNEVSSAAYNINSLLSDLATVNLAHIKNGQGASSQSEINSILSELSSYTDFVYDQNTNGSYNVYIGGVAVVQGTKQTYELQTDFDPNGEEPLTLKLHSLENDEQYININNKINSGSLKSAVEFLNGTNETVGFSTINDMKAAIKSAEVAFKDALNEIQTYANPEENTYAAYITSLNGELVLAANGDEPPIPITPPELLILDENNKIKVNPEVMNNPFYVAAARIDLNNYEEGDDWTKSIGNADNANYMSALKNKKICSYGTGENNCTLSQFLINNATKNGIDLASAESKADLYQGIADSDQEEYNNLIGVNLDEELADMIKYQRAYEASAAVFSVINNIMQMIVNMV